MDIQTLTYQIRQRGGRITKVRQALLELFLEKACVWSQNDLKKRLSNRNLSVDRTTLYRELDFLYSHKFIKKITLENNKTYYELADDHHHHLVCLSCNSIKPVALQTHLRLEEKKLEKSENFIIKDHALEFYGWCNKCQ